eukprot:UN30365
MEVFDTDEKFPVYGFDLLAYDHKFENLFDNLIKDSENYASLNNGWETDRHENFPTTDLPLHNVPTLFKLIQPILVIMLEFIFEHHNIIVPHFEEAFIVKYETDGQQGLNFHMDDSIITFQVALNDDFVGGGTYFNADELTIHRKMGEGYTFFGSRLHSGLPITKGVRYILV